MIDPWLESFTLEQIVKELKEHGTILFSWSPDQNTSHNIMLSWRFTQLGTLSWGGQARGKVLVAVMLRGFFFFDLPNEDPEYPHPEYVTEKLGLNPSDAKDIARLLNGVNRNL